MPMPPSPRSATPSTSARKPRDPQRTASRGSPAANAPGGLSAAMLALNALFLPYRGLYHDAVLYGLQVLNRAEGGRFGGDLFLRYGSQDNYSIFSWVAAPLAAALGVPAAFLLLYLAAKA